jgi:HSP20 family molecular chaperone IbpA
VAVFDRRLDNRRQSSHDFDFACHFCPATDVYRTSTGWLIKLELAGVSRSDVRVIASGNSLIVSGRRRDSVVNQGCQCVSLEISYSSFERRIEFPCNIERARFELEMRDGMLLIHLSTDVQS